MHYGSESSKQRLAGSEKFKLIEYEVYEIK